PLLDSIVRSNAEHVNRTADLLLQTGKRNFAMLGLSFKAGTDDLRESPQVQLIKRLLGEGCQVLVWDQDVSLGRLAGSNREYIENVVPHVGSLLSRDLGAVVRGAEVVIVGNKAVRREQLTHHLRAEQTVIDLVNLDSAHRPSGASRYEGICW